MSFLDFLAEVLGFGQQHVIFIHRFIAALRHLECLGAVKFARREGCVVVAKALGAIQRTFEVILVAALALVVVLSPCLIIGDSDLSLA